MPDLFDTQDILPVNETTEEGSDHEAKSNKKIKRAELERHVWDAQELLRGNVDASEFKDYIFALFFLKVVVDNSDDGEIECWWGKLTSLKSNIGSALNKLCVDVGVRIPKIGDALTNVDFENKRLDDKLLTDLISHYSKFVFARDNLEDIDALGHAYEFLLAKFADSAGSKGGEFYTPVCVTELATRIVAHLLKPVRSKITVYDPTCGSGGLLLKVNEALQASCFGQEMNVSTAAIAKMNMYVHQVDGQIERGNTLTDPKFVEGERVQQFDCVVANPPFSVKKWGTQEQDKYKRFDKWGKLPKSQGDYAFLLHCIESIKPDGVGVVILAPGTLYRQQAEKKIREKIIDAGIVKAIIHLPANLFYNTSISTVMWVIDKRNEPGEGIFFIDAQKLVTKQTKQSIIETKHMDAIIESFDNPGEYGLSEYVYQETIEENNYLLSPSIYIQSKQDLALPSKDNETFEFGGIPANVFEHPRIKAELEGIDLETLFEPHQREGCYQFKEDVKFVPDLLPLLPAGKNYDKEVLAHLLSYDREGNIARERNIQRLMTNSRLLGKIVINEDGATCVVGGEKLSIDQLKKYIYNDPDSSTDYAELTKEQLEFRLLVQKEEILTVENEIATIKQYLSKLQ